LDLATFVGTLKDKILLGLRLIKETMVEEGKLVNYLFELQEKETQTLEQFLGNLKVKIENCPGPNVPPELKNEINYVKTGIKRLQRNLESTKVK